MSLVMELHLVERHDTRILVGVTLAPEDGAQQLDGVAVQLFSPDAEPLSPKVLLPISGALQAALSTTVDLRTDGGRGIPSGSELVATAWWPGGHLSRRTSADRGNRVEEHIRPQDVLLPDWTDELEPVSEDDMERVRRLFPGIVRSPEGKVLAIAADESPDDLAGAYGLDDDDAAWLADLADDEEY